MKKTLLKFAAIALLVGFVGCQDKLDTGGNDSPTATYIGEENAVIDIKKANEGGEAVVDVRLSGLSNTDVAVTVSVNDFFAKYNKKNRTRYRMLPTSEYELYEVKNPSNVSKNGNISFTIKAGESSSKIGVRVKPLDDEKYPVGIKYAIPLEITSSSRQILSNREAVVSFNRPYKTSKTLLLLCRRALWGSQDIYYAFF